MFPRNKGWHMSSLTSNMYCFGSRSSAQFISLGRMSCNGEWPCGRILSPSLPKMMPFPSCSTPSTTSAAFPTAHVTKLGCCFSPSSVFELGINSSQALRQGSETYNPICCTPDRTLQYHLPRLVEFLCHVHHRLFANVTGLPVAATCFMAHL